jgi:methyl-accepting chemotaxis protein
MERSGQTWFMVFVAATTLSVAIQLGMVAAVFFGLRRLHAKIKEIEGRARSHGPTVAKMAADLGEALGSLKRVTNNVAEISQRIKSTVNGAADLSGRLFIGADHVIDDAVTRVERISDTVEHGIARPVRELQANWRHYGLMLSIFLRRRIGSEEPRRT